ncbi:MAG: YbaN family protein [Gammaproteobacteria bacterium]|nr:YbaN family protein [Gammaproteobacteria bacterium]
MTNLIFLILAYLFLALALLGIVLPGLPTVPFLLLSAWFAARGSARLHRWLYAHPHFGKLLNDWEQQKAVSRTSKVIAVLMLVISWGVMYYRVESVWILVSVAILFVVVAAYLFSRPEPKSENIQN